MMVEKGSGSNIKRNWESTSASNIPQKYKRDPPPVITFYGVVKAGDFVLDKTLLEKFAAGVNVKELPQQASYKKTPLYHETESGIHYLTNREPNLIFPIWTVITESPIRNLLWRKIRRKPWWGFKKEIGSKRNGGRYRIFRTGVERYSDQGEYFKE